MNDPAITQYQIQNITKLILHLSKRYEHPDPVAKLYNALSDVNYEIGKEMLKERIQQEELCKKN